MKEIKTSAYNKISKKKDYEYNPWAVCHTTVDKDEDPEKYERCVKEVKEKQSKKEAEKQDKWIQKAVPESHEGRFGSWCENNGFSGVCQSCIDKAISSGGHASKMANFAINVSKGKYHHSKKTLVDKRIIIAQIETIDLVARYIGDGYLSAAERADNPNVHSERFWSDYYDENYDRNEGETVSLDSVPVDIANKLLVQGTSEQFFKDGYEAANAAAPYVNKDNIEEIPRDTPMGIEDDHPIPGIDY